MVATLTCRDNGIIPGQVDKERVRFRNLLRMDLEQKPGDDPSSPVGVAFRRLESACARYLEIYSWNELLQFVESVLYRLEVLILTTFLQSRRRSDDGEQTLELCDQIDFI